MSTYEQNRRRLRNRSGSGDPLAMDKLGAKYLLNEFVKLFTEGKTPFVSPEDVEKEKDRRASLGLDPDYRDDLLADFLAPQNVEGREQRIQERLEQIGQSKLPPAAAQQFDNTLAGQYQRYFETPEFDGVFGAGARGTGAPEDAAAMEVLGNQIRAPKKDTNIASMYAAQSAMGRVNQDKIQDYFADTNLPGNVKLKDGRTALQAWAEKNPMLAQREYMKAEAERVANMPDNTQYDTGTAVRGEMPGTVEQQIRYGAGSPISKSPTEYDISNSDEEEFQKVYDQLFARSKAAK